MGRLEIAATPDRRRFLLTAEGELDGPAFRRAMEGWLAGAAQGRFDHDRLYDLTRYVGTVGNDDVRHIGGLMRAAGADVPQGRTVFVTRDAGFAFWVRSMQLELPRRRMDVVGTMEAAEALLAGRS